MKYIQSNIKAQIDSAVTLTPPVLGTSVWTFNLFTKSYGVELAYQFKANRGASSITDYEAFTQFPTIISRIYQQIM